MKLRNLLMTGVLVASMSTSSVAFAATQPTQLSHTASARLNKQELMLSGLLHDVAMVLNLDQTTLIDQLRTGKSITDIAEESGVNKSYLIAALISKEKDELDIEVNNGTLTLHKETQILFKATSQLSTLLDQTTLLAK
ncbi:hypothetical protein PU629_10095 [Pullulanibacillus sp. KACC 23026]|uniref:hypothetical protein n=1 Tax=Pullulanibacillus sp. KACC 23026 TaxID=3028315 RepID=UPI0023B1FD1D|nr:hypothetical protein [Pullulanibacillus sp. KACC 23026]WEG14665.1 hypothetical protein PU629_10095 [Pullulanibacillus sp. KACC 23026]